MTELETKAEPRRRVVREERAAPEAAVVEYSAYFSGPLPPPATLARYEEICPGSAERILGMAEEQAAHRQTLEKSVIESNCRSQERGPILGFVVAMTVILIGAGLLWNGRDIAGLTALIAALAAIVVPFVVGKQKQKEELARKRSEVRETLQQGEDSPETERSET